MALYEVIRKGRTRLTIGPKPVKTRIVTAAKADPGDKQSAGITPHSQPQPGGPWDALEGSSVPNKRTLELSYPVVVVLLLACILTVLVAFRMGQIYGEKSRISSYVDKNSVKNEEIIPKTAAPSFKEIRDEKENIAKTSWPAAVKKTTVAKPKGDHIIIIATYSQGRDLEPVQEHYKENGVEAEIQNRGGYYFLITKNRYSSTVRTGSDGFYALEKIKQIGAGYRSPPGYETFGSRPFQDAYGRKMRY
jgi:hypothetical protein